MGFYQLHCEQKLNTSPEMLWNFISTPVNLKKITPDYMGFEVTSPNLPERMYPGMIIIYTVKPMLNLKMRWVTEITQVKDYAYFVDEQRIGPYAMWHHEHLLKPIKDGVNMVDIVSYQPPFGVLGSLANHIFIGKQLSGIFEYRRKVLNDLFGEIN